MSNPFDELGVDPRMSVKELTEVMKRMAERAHSDEERERIQSFWRMLTLRERDRLRWAFLAHPRPPAAEATSVDALREAVPTVPVRAKFDAPVPAVRDCLDGGNQGDNFLSPAPRWDGWDQTD